MGTDVIELRRINKSYGGKEVLRDVSMTLATGETTALMAPSGWGKTTLLRILLGLEQAESGEILGREGLRLSAVFQEDRLLERLTARGNLLFVAQTQAQRREIAPLLEELGLGGESGAVETFSGGMKRRLAVARALLAEYDLLVLDEPFRGLDEQTCRRTMEVVRRRSRGKTVLLVTHELHLAQELAQTIVRFPME